MITLEEKKGFGTWFRKNKKNIFIYGGIGLAALVALITGAVVWKGKDESEATVCITDGGTVPGEVLMDSVKAAVKEVMPDAEWKEF